MRPPEAAARLRRPDGRALVVAVAVLAVVTALGVTTVLPRPTVAGGLGLVVVAVCLTALYQTTRSASFSPVSVTFWAFVTVWVGFAPLLQIRDRRLPWPDLPLDQYYVSAQVILLFAVLAYWAGNTRSLPRRGRTPRPAPGSPSRRRWRSPSPPGCWPSSACR